MHVPPLPPRPSPAPARPSRDKAPPARLDEGPLAQSVALAFRLVSLAALATGVIWACSNVREVASDRTAVVERFGRISHVQTAGLLLAWPEPFEQVHMLPAGSRQLPLPVAAEATSYDTDETDLQLEPSDDVIHMERDRDAANASYLLTADGNVVRLEATLFFHITDPAAYVLSQSHVAPALRRLFLASAVSLAASHRLDDFLVAQVAQADGGAGAPPTDPLLVARRQALRGDLVQMINQRLAAIEAKSGQLGIEVARADLVALLPPRAKSAFDQVLTASQIAEQNVAAARTDAEHITQEAQRRHDALLTDATAAASERIRSASTDVAPVAALEDSLAGNPQGAAARRPERRDALLLAAWRDRVGNVLRQAGSVTVVDPRDGAQTILSGPTTQADTPGAAP